MLEAMKQRVYEANMRLKTEGLVVLTWGNVSEIDRESGLIVIKPSGVAYEAMTPAQMVVVDLEGHVVEGDLNPSSDTKTHLVLYKKFSTIGGITHTHARTATTFAQAGVPVPPLGTTHADYFHGPILCTRLLTEDEVNGDYEYETGNVIAELLEGKDPMEVPAVLVREHGPFTFGKNAQDSVDMSLVLEEVCKMAMGTKALNEDALLRDVISDKHYYRKHGANSYYGQK